MVDRRKPILCRPLDLGTIASGNQRAGTPAQHLGRHKAAGLVWRSDGAANVWARGQLPAGSVVDFFALLNTNAIDATRVRLRLGTSQAEVDGAADYDSGSVPIAVTTVPAEDAALATRHALLELDTPVPATWWRIDVTSHSGDFEAGFMVAGTKIEFDRFYDNTGHGFGARDLGKVEMSNWGVMDETPGKVLPTIDFTLSWLSEAEVEQSVRPLMRQIGVRQPVYCCFDPTSTAYRDTRTYFGPLQKALQTAGVRKPKTYSMEFSLISILG